MRIPRKAATATAVTRTVVRVRPGRRARLRSEKAHSGGRRTRRSASGPKSVRMP